MKPDFLGIGAQKAATTWLFEVLNNHPDTSMPLIKEFHYFDMDKKYGAVPITRKSKSYVWRRVFHAFIFARSLKKKIVLARFLFKKPCDEWYVSFFDRSKFSGEITPSYSLLDVEDIKRVHNLNPNIKLVFILRNPIDRAWSQVKMGIEMNGNKSSLDDQDLLDLVKRDEVLKRGDYEFTIDNWQSVFPKNQLKLIFFDDIKKDPETEIKKILSFLNLKYYPNLNPSKIINKGAQTKMPVVVNDFLKKYYTPKIINLNKKINSPIIRDWID